MKPSAVVAKGVVLCPEGRKLFPQMSVLKNLMLGAYVHRGDKAGNLKKLQEVYELFPILAERREQAAGSLSGGQQQMVAIGRALMGRPQALLLDEPSLGLAPLVVKQVFEVIQRMSDDPVETCEECGAPVERVFHPVAVHFKGSGFYTTDYAKKAKAGAGAGKDSNSGGSDSKGDSSDTGSKGESKSSDSGSGGGKEKAASSKSD